MSNFSSLTNVRKNRQEQAKHSRIRELRRTFGTHHPHTVVGDFSISFRKSNGLSELLELPRYSQKVTEPTNNDPTQGQIDGTIIYNNANTNATLNVLDEVLQTEINDKT